eukprot:gene11637-34346_t
MLPTYGGGHVSYGSKKKSNVGATFGLIVLCALLVAASSCTYTVDHGHTIYVLCPVCPSSKKKSSSGTTFGIIVLCALLFAASSCTYTVDHGHTIYVLCPVCPSSKKKSSSGTTFGIIVLCALLFAASSCTYNVDHRHTIYEPCPVCFSSKKKSNGGATFGIIVLCALLFGASIAAFLYRGKSIACELNEGKLVLKSSNLEKYLDHHKAVNTPLESTHSHTQRSLVESQKSLRQSASVASENEELRGQIQELKDKLWTENEVSEAWRRKVKHIEDHYKEREGDWHSLSLQWTKYEKDSVDENTRWLKQLSVCSGKLLKQLSECTGKDIEDMLP